MQKSQEATFLNRDPNFLREKERRLTYKEDIKQKTEIKLRLRNKINK